MTEIKGTKISVQTGDITDMEVDAIAHAINKHLWLGSGVAGSIRRKAGMSIVQEALEKGPIEIGEAVATDGGKLKARHIIHAAAMDRDLMAEGKDIDKALSSTLECARQLGAQTLALSAFGTGLGGLPSDKSAKIMFKRLIEYLDQNPGAFTEIFFVIDNEESADTFRKIVNGARD